MCLVGLTFKTLNFDQFWCSVMVYTCCKEKSPDEGWELSFISLPGKIAWYFRGRHNLYLRKEAFKSGSAWIFFSPLSEVHGVLSNTTSLSSSESHKSEISISYIFGSLLDKPEQLKRGLIPDVRVLRDEDY